VQKTYYPKPGEVTHDWYVVDAAGQNLGRFATQVARLLLGKNKPQFTPGVDTGDFVIIVNAEKIAVTGKKLDDKFYYRHSGYPGGIKQISLRDQLERFPERVIRSAVWGMLPHNRYGRKLMKKLKIYAGPGHPHAAQKPQTLALEADRQSD
jgi:large subunit ribosomal protein L13